MKMEETKSFQSKLDSLALIRQYVTNAARESGLDDKLTYKLCLAVDEMASNIIMYGYQESGIQGLIDIHINADENRIMITLEDDGTAYDPRQHELPSEEEINRPLDERPVGGLGLFLVFNSVDDYKYEYVGGRNRNIFIMNLRNQKV